MGGLTGLVSGSTDIPVGFRTKSCVCGFAFFFFLKTHKCFYSNRKELCWDCRPRLGVRDQGGGWAGLGWEGIRDPELGVGLAPCPSPSSEDFRGELGGSTTSEEAFVVLWLSSLLSFCLEALRLFRGCYYRMSYGWSLVLSGVPEPKLLMEGGL